MKLNADAINYTITGDGDMTLNLSVSRENKSALKAIVSEAKTYGKMRVEIEQWKKARSTDQNAMMWALLEILGRASGMSSWDAYIWLLKEAGTVVYLHVLPEAKQALERVFRVVEAIEERVHNGRTVLMCRCITGSSHYDTKEMSALIDKLLLKLAELDLDTKDVMDIDYMRREIRGAQGKKA